MGEDVVLEWALCGGWDKNDYKIEVDSRVGLEQRPLDLGSSSGSLRL